MPHRPPTKGISPYYLSTRPVKKKGKKGQGKYAGSSKTPVVLDAPPQKPVVDKGRDRVSGEELRRGGPGVGEENWDIELLSRLGAHQANRDLIDRVLKEFAQFAFQRLRHNQTVNVPGVGTIGSKNGAAYFKPGAALKTHLAQSHTPSLIGNKNPSIGYVTTPKTNISMNSGAAGAKKPKTTAGKGKKKRRPRIKIVSGGLPTLGRRR